MAEGTVPGLEAADLEGSVGYCIGDLTGSGRRGLPGCQAEGAPGFAAEAPGRPGVFGGWPGWSRGVLDGAIRYCGL